MKTIQEPNQLFFDRQAEFRIWMLRNKLTFVEIGKRLGGMTGSGVCRLIQGERMPVARHQQMLALGIPEELLPFPLDVPLGRKPHKVKAAVSA